MQGPWGQSGLGSWQGCFGPRERGGVGSDRAAVIRCWVRHWRSMRWGLESTPGGFAPPRPSLQRQAGEQVGWQERPGHPTGSAGPPAALSCGGPAVQQLHHGGPRGAAAPAPSNESGCAGPGRPWRQAAASSACAPGPRRTCPQIRFLLSHYHLNRSFRPHSSPRYYLTRIIN